MEMSLLIRLKSGGMERCGTGSPPCEYCVHVCLAVHVHVSLCVCVCVHVNALCTHISAYRSGLHVYTFTCLHACVCTVWWPPEAGASQGRRAASMDQLCFYALLCPLSFSWKGYKNPSAQV